MTVDAEITKAQLILVGGRPMPNILTLIHQEPELIIAVCSLQSYKKEWPSLKKAIKNLLPLARIEERVIDGYLLEEIEAACESMLGKSADENWVFNITNATSIMSIGAYNIAKKYAQRVSIDCWYLDTARSRVITLAGSGANEQIFKIKVDQYAAIHDCRLVSGSLESDREYCEQHWLPFTKILVDDLHNIDLLKKVVKAITHKKPKKKDGPQELSITDISEEMFRLLTAACDVGLLTDLRREKQRITFNISYLQANYLEGPWLEAYVWNEVHQLGIFADCLWNQKLITDTKLDDKDSKNELDVSMIYKAQLFIVECKTGENDGFDSEILYKIDSVANPLGNKSVGKVVVMSLPIPDKRDQNKYKQYEGFKEKADEREIMLVTREKLSEVGAKLRQLVEDPKFNR